MEINPVRDQVVKILGEPENIFAKDELAFLASTGKIEDHFRDVVAWKLHPWAKHKGILVGREWSGIKGQMCDVALLQEASGSYRAVAVVELKAMTTYDPLKRGDADRRRFFGGLKQDMRRWSNLAPAETIGILLATHPKNGIEEGKWSSRRGPVKYLNWVESARREFGSLDEVKRLCLKAVRENFAGYNVEPLNGGSILAGSAFDATFEVLYWVISSP